MSDKLQVAFDHACDEGELEVASELLETLEIVLLRTPPMPDRRETIVAPLLAAHERLWHLRANGGTKRFPTQDPAETASDTEESEAG